VNLRPRMKKYEMESEVFFQKIKTYTMLTTEAELAWKELLKEKRYSKGQYFISVGQAPKKVAFVVKGLFSQYYIADDGTSIITYFFPEGRIAGSIPAMLTKTESLFAIEALEDTRVLEYDYHEFKKLVSTYKDIATFYIKYIEQHWIIEKEPLEVAVRNDTAAKQYNEFLRKYPELVRRLKKHQIASYLGITPTQLSRISVTVNNF
jgi:CRP-like cAMP-binding protein